MEQIREILESSDIIYIVSTFGSIGSAIAMALCLISMIKKKIRKEKFENEDIKRNAIGFIVAVVIMVACVAVINNEKKSVNANSFAEEITTLTTSTTEDEESKKESESISIQESLSIQESISISESEEESKKQEELSLSEEVSKAEEQRQKEELEYIKNNAKLTLLDKQKLNTDLLGIGNKIYEFTDNLNEVEEQDEFTVNINSDSLIWIKFEHDNLTEDRNGWEIQIINSDSLVLCEFVSNWNKPESYSAKIGVPKGSYTITVSESGYHSNAQYVVSVFNEETLPCEIEQNNQVLSSTNIEFETNNAVSTVYGNLAYGDDVDFYKFEMQNDGHISLKFEHRNLTYDDVCWHIEIWNENSVVLYEFNSNMNRINILSPNIGLKAGTYYIKVEEAYTYSSELYAMSLCRIYGNNWENETNGSISNSKTIESGVVYFGSLKNDSDEDYYTFSCNKSGMYALTFKHELEDYDSVRWEIQVLDEQSESVLSQPITSNWNDLETRESFDLEEGKVYYLKVYHYIDYSDIDYSFFIQNAS